MLLPQHFSNSSQTSNLSFIFTTIFLFTGKTKLSLHLLYPPLHWSSILHLSTPLKLPIIYPTLIQPVFIFYGFIHSFNPSGLSIPTLHCSKPSTSFPLPPVLLCLISYLSSYPLIPSCHCIHPFLCHVSLSSHHPPLPCLFVIFPHHFSPQFSSFPTLTSLSFYTY